MTLLLTKLMFGLSGLGINWDNVLGPEGSEKRLKFGWVKDVVDAVYYVIVPLLVVVGAAGMIYAIVLGVQMARADSTEKREEMKKRLINVIVGLAIAIGLILFFILFINFIVPALIPETLETTATK